MKNILLLTDRRPDLIIQTQSELLIINFIALAHLASQMLIKRQRLEHLQTLHTLEHHTRIYHDLAHVHQFILFLPDLYPLLHRIRSSRAIESLSLRVPC